MEKQVDYIATAEALGRQAFEQWYVPDPMKHDELQSFLLTVPRDKASLVIEAWRSAYYKANDASLKSHLNPTHCPKAAIKWPEPTVEEPDMEQLQEWLMDSICEATDGCEIEHDGVCKHGHPSWFRYLGVI